ncbi:lipoprotein [Nocardioides flavus (ex Wang et al. 2016)]|uniref:Lipoprotein n=1 Tax=Nocardioides flavus (ex Wang et al. 2016) TaxID=2058780 RepID=A0ABQ3HH87_9ACTN|nr:DUF305 domain-containing protein [Nocardioides flavus (ex Wang et al. 2016)]GHE16916.1 lipoprotein [Nocardioides flavus (ex Wang et al. 2016)]
MNSKTTTRTRALGAVALTLALGAGLTACGDDTDANSSGEVSTTEHNDADVAFASDMITHHAQALSMVDLTLDRPLDPEVQALAEDIRAAQAPEIETMADWLTAWGEEVPETMRDHANAGHDMGDMSDTMDDMGHDDMPGMMTAEDMDALENASDEEFQDMWVEMMVEHHEGAVEMAETQQEDGQFKDAVDLAGQIIDAQQKEIDVMNDLLDS